MSTNFLKVCLRVTSELIKEPLNVFFSTRFYETCQTYDSIENLKNPINLNIVMTKINDKKYKSMHEWYNDITLIYQTAINLSKNEKVQCMAKFLLNNFQKKAYGTNLDIDQWSAAVMKISTEINELIERSPVQQGIDPFIIGIVNHASQTLPISIAQSQWTVSAINELCKNPDRFYDVFCILKQTQSDFDQTSNKIAIEFDSLKPVTMNSLFYYALSFQKGNFEHLDQVLSEPDYEFQPTNDQKVSQTSSRSQNTKSHKENTQKSNNSSASRQSSRQSLADDHQSLHQNKLAQQELQNHANQINQQKQINLIQQPNLQNLMNKLNQSNIQTQFIQPSQANINNQQIQQAQVNQKTQQNQIPEQPSQLNQVQQQNPQQNQIQQIISQQTQTQEQAQMQQQTLLQSQIQQQNQESQEKNIPIIQNQTDQVNQINHQDLQQQQNLIDKLNQQNLVTKVKSTITDERETIKNTKILFTTKNQKEHLEQNQQQIPQQTPDQIPQQTPEQNQHQISDQIPQQIPEQNQQQIPDQNQQQIPDQIPQQIPEHNQQQIPEQTQHLIPEQNIQYTQPNQASNLPTQIKDDDIVLPTFEINEQPKKENLLDQINTQTGIFP